MISTVSKESYLVAKTAGSQWSPRLGYFANCLKLDDWTDVIRCSIRKYSRKDCWSCFTKGIHALAKGLILCH